MPVNQVPVDSNGLDLMAVAWYKKDARTVAWPMRTKRYDCRWPANPDKIIIASELGSEVLGQVPLDPLVFTGMRIYNQPDRAKSGFNPNDEHAIFAPANSSSGFNAIFALRSDFTEAERNKTSKPYSLLKYIRTDDQKWAYRVYQVVATGAGYEYLPVSRDGRERRLRALSGSSARATARRTRPPARRRSRTTRTRSGPSRPAPWSAEYWYPLQPTFYYDRDANGIADTSTPDCVAWLGGVADDPVDVTYDIVWPTNAPVLLVGETLLGSKRGLPEIAAQAAVEVIFDEKVQRTVDNLVYDPTRSLVRLIDPLEQRFVYLNAIPDSVATDLDPGTGKLVPYSNAERHDSTAGDDRGPHLLRPAEQEAHLRGHPRRERRRRSIPAPQRPERERARSPQADRRWRRQRGLRLRRGLRHADGRTAPGTRRSRALYRLSRNPNRLDLDLEADRCHLEAQIDPTTGLTVPIIVCATPQDGEVDNGLLLGLQDADGDGTPGAAAGGRLHAGAHRRLCRGHRFRDAGFQQRHHRSTRCR